MFDFPLTITAGYVLSLLCLCCAIVLSWVGVSLINFMLGTDNPNSPIKFETNFLTKYIRNTLIKWEWNNIQEIRGKFCVIKDVSDYITAYYRDSDDTFCSINPNDRGYAKKCGYDTIEEAMKHKRVACKFAFFWFMLFLAIVLDVLILLLRTHPETTIVITSVLLFVFCIRFISNKLWDNVAKT